MTVLPSPRHISNRASADAVMALRELILEESGQDLIEYALIFSFVALGAIASMKSVSTSIAAVFNAVGTALTNAT